MKHHTQRKTGFKILTIEEPVFYSTTVVVLGVKNYAGVAQYFLEAGISYNKSVRLQNDFGGLTILHEEVVYLFLPDIDPADPESMKVLVHELFHAAHFQMDACGQPNKGEGGAESHAYFIGFLTKEIWSYVKKKVRRGH